VDCFGRVVLNLLVKPEAPVASYLTPLTGLTAENIAQCVCADQRSLDLDATSA